MKIGAGRVVPPFRVMDVARAANERAATLPSGAPKILRMEVGQPGTGLPHGAKLAVQAALQSGDALGYTEALGNPSLRARIARHMEDWYGVDIPAARIAVTLGASGAFSLAFLASFDQGDKVALAAPYYPPYVNTLTALGMQPVVMPCGIETGFQPTIGMLDALPEKPAGLIIASPANPTGSMLAPAELEALCRYCDENGIRLISDEIYHGLTYGKPQASAAQFSASAVVVNSFSKYFSMTGWRVGWMALPEDMVRVTERLAQNMFICPPHIAQIAAEAAFTCRDELEANRATYQAARSILTTGLREAGYSTFAPPDGAFYVYADVSSRAEDSALFCDQLLASHNIAATPGLDFDAERGGRYVRFSYCAPLADIEDAVARLKQPG
ncbi:MAG: aminotransferase class I/II-fold pyridoxal phosphate-dependent enzyme [Rhodospirillales bacterium]|nr:aminotransferase class I/II-fold pyridoxal phosphate-dependent enzyme [Rhodospirillales bacterium]